MNPRLRDVINVYYPWAWREESNKVRNSIIVTLALPLILATQIAWACLFGIYCLAEYVNTEANR